MAVTREIQGKVVGFVVVMRYCSVQTGPDVTACNWQTYRMLPASLIGHILSETFYVCLIGARIRCSFFLPWHEWAFSFSSPGNMALSSNPSHRAKILLGGGPFSKGQGIFQAKAPVWDTRHYQGWCFLLFGQTICYRCKAIHNGQDTVHVTSGAVCTLH